MNIKVNKNINVQSRGAGGESTGHNGCATTITPHNVRLASGVIPEVVHPSVDVDSHTGVSTRYAHLVNIESNLDIKVLHNNPLTERHWYTLRCTYGREKKSYEYLLAEGIRAFYPTITRKKTVEGKSQLIEESRLPNIFFAYGTHDELKEYVYNNVSDGTKYLRFYYNQHHDGTREPLIVPDAQIKSLMLICDSNADDIILKNDAVDKFVRGQHVKVVEGEFAGVEGIVARWCGQQRVGIVIEGLLTMATAYVPTAFLEVTE